MAQLMSTSCLKLVAKINERDQDALLSRLDELQAQGMPAQRAQIQAAIDVLSGLRREAANASSIPEDQDINPDQPDIKRSRDRAMQDVEVVPSTLLGPSVGGKKPESRFDVYLTEPATKRRPELRGRPVASIVKYAGMDDPVFTNLYPSVMSLDEDAILSLASSNPRGGKVPGAASWSASDIKRSSARDIRYEISRDEDDEGTFVFAKDMSQKDALGNPLTIGHLHVPDGAIDADGGFKIGDIYVHGKMRRQGLATEMLKRMEDELGGKAIGAASVFSPDGKAFFDGYSQSGIKRSAARVIPDFVEENIEDTEYPGSKYAEFDDGAAYVKFFADNKGNLRVTTLNTEGSDKVRGRDVLRWLGQTYGRPILVNEVDPPASGFWDKMQDEGIIKDWSRDAYRGKTSSLPDTDIKRSAARDGEITIDLSADRAKQQKAKEWVAKVSEMFPRNPMNGRQRVMMFGEEDMAIFELDDSVTSPGAVEIKWIQAYPLRSGNGTKAMQELQRLAAGDGMSLTLYPWDKGRVSQASLIKFYKKQGFEPIRRGGKDMIWRPDGAIKRSRKRQPSEIFGREIAPAAIRAYKSLSAGAKSIVDGWNVNWSMGQGRLRNSKDFDEVVKAYEPVREKLRQVYGSTVPAFRGEKQDGTESTDDRFLFSWTPMRDIAAGFAVNRRYGMPAEIPQSKVDEQIEAYSKTGIARLNGYKFVRKDPGDYEPDGPDYYYIYQGGEMITDGDDIARALQQEKDERDAWISELRDGGKLYAGNIPVDSVAFIPVGANLRQPEFVAEYNPRKDAAGEIRLSTKRNELGFHSALERGIEDMQTKSALAGAWKAQIKGLVNKGAVKQDEVTWSGIEDWLDLQDGKVTKEAIAEYLKQGGVQVEEVTLVGDGNEVSDADFAVMRAEEEWDSVRQNLVYARSMNHEDDIQALEEELRVAEEELRTAKQEAESATRIGGPTKYGQYTLPGGENYREVLLTLPVKKEKWVMRQVADGRWEVLLDDGSRSLGFFKTEGSAGSELDYVNRTASESPKGVYKSNHWDQKNVLAHIRVNDRTDADGKRVLFVEEIQSDWGQDGKKKGVVKSYRPDEVQPISAIEAGKMTSADEELFWHFKTPDNVFSIPKSKYADRDAAREYIIREKKINSGGVPDAPFIGKTDGWLNLALKRVIAMAVDGGYDAVAFVNGDQSADRYDLSKQVDELMIERDGDSFTIAMKPIGGYYGDGGRWSGKAQELPDVVGKELADKVAAQPEGRSYINGVDLKVGGEGMKAFYDKIVPNAVKALLKKVGGGQLEMVILAGEPIVRDENWTAREFEARSRLGISQDEWDRMPRVERQRLTFGEDAPRVRKDLAQPGFTITDAMREKVTTEGLPLFSRKRDVTETPEFQAWFSGSQVIDENGLPKVQYHSTNSTDNFGVFRTDRELGAHFGTERQANERGGGFVYPVYLSIKNPLRLEDKGDFHAGNVLLQLRRMGMITRQQAADMSSDVRPIQAIIESAGYDGVVYLNRNEIPGVFGEDGVSGDDLSEMTDQEVIEMFGDDAQDSWIAFRPEQIKSAIGNNGDFDPENPDIRRSTGRTSTGAAWDSPSASKFDDLVYKFQDKNIETKRVVEAIKDASGAIADDLNVYLQEELYHGRAAKRTEDFVNMELNPLVEQLAKDGLKLEDLEEFLHARHAPEANDVIARRNPGVAGLQDGGSGMKTADALNYMATLPADLKAKLEAAAAKVDDIIAQTRKLYVDYELESQETVDAWGKMFQHYIPLQREDKDGSGSPGLGQGFSVKGKETKGRTGSTRKVVDILANIAMQREKAIVRGEKNRVSQALVGLASANPNEGFWTVDEVPTERVYDERLGVVVDRPDPMWKARENTMVAKIVGPDGKVKEHAVVFNEEDERAMRMAKSLKNLDATQLEGLLGVSAKISRYFAAINTQYNPVFGVVNLVRDVQGAVLNLSSTPLENDRAKIAKDTASALRGIYGDARAARKGKNPSSAWAQLWDEFQEVGGQTGYRDLFRTSAERAEAIKKTLNPDAWADSKLGKIFTANGALKVPMAQAKRGAGWIFDWLSDYNLAMENGVRLAAYKAGLERGMSKEQAASVAKNLTVNFNRKGQVSQQAGAMYAFFNASVQGTARIAQTIFTMEPGKPKTIRLSPFGKKVVYGGMLVGSVQALALAAAGFGDEDPPQFARERSLIIPLMNGKYMTIPMPLGFHVIPNIGRITTEFVLSGFSKPHERALQLFGLFADTFNPIGNAGMSMQTLAPTALDPLVALTENRDWTGKPIARESMNPATPGHATARDTATALSKFLAEAINTASGGNQYVAGVFSPSPDQIDYLIGQITGGVGRELSKVEQSSLAALRGEELPTFKIPLVGRFIGDSKQQASEGTAFYANTERINRLETEIKGLQKDGKYAEAAELRRTNSDAYLITVANQAERQIQKLRAQKRELIKEGASREQVKAVEERITAVMARLNRAAERLREKQGN